MQMPRLSYGRSNLSVCPSVCVLLCNFIIMAEAIIMMFTVSSTKDSATGSVKFIQEP